MAQPAFHDAGPDLPNGTRLGGRMDDFIGALGEPLRRVPQDRGLACAFPLASDRGDGELTVLFDGTRAVHLAWQAARPLRSAILCRLEMLKRWPEDAVPEGAFSLRNYESTMSRVRSDRLARALAPEWFVDAIGEPVQPGTFTCVVTRHGWSMSAGGRVLAVADPDPR